MLKKNITVNASRPDAQKHRDSQGPADLELTGVPSAFIPPHSVNSGPTGPTEPTVPTRTSTLSHTIIQVRRALDSEATGMAAGLGFLPERETSHSRISFQGLRAPQDIGKHAGAHVSVRADKEDTVALYQPMAAGAQSTEVRHRVARGVAGVMVSEIQDR